MLGKTGQLGEGLIARLSEELERDVIGLGRDDFVCGSHGLARLDGIRAIDTLVIAAGGFCVRSIPKNSIEGVSFIEREATILGLIDQVCALTLDVRRVVYFSSARVYCPSMAPLGTASGLCAETAYGVAKLMMEASLAERFGQRLTVIRLFNNHGPRHFQREFFLFDRWRAHLSGSGYPLRDGGVLLDCSHVDSVVDSIVEHFDELFCFRVLNLGSGLGYSLGDLDCLLEQCTNFRPGDISTDWVRQELASFEVNKFKSPSFVCAQDQGSLVIAGSLDKLICELVNYD